MVAQLEAGVSDGELPVFGVAGDRLLGEAAAELFEGFAFPVLMLAAVVGEDDWVASDGERAERSAGVDLGELALIPIFLHA